MNHSSATFRLIGCFLLFVFVLLGACSGEGGRGGTGSISFSVRMPRLENGPLYRDARFACDEYGIVDVVARVTSGGDPVASAGPWPCNTGEGIISGVEEGENYRVTISMRDNEGRTLFQGTSKLLNVKAGETTDAGTIDVTATNEAPVFEAMAARQVNVGERVSFTVRATDPDGDTLTYSATSLPEGAEFDEGSAQFSWIPGQDQLGSHTASFRVTDDGEPPLSDELDVIIVVASSGEAPVFEAIGAQSVNEGQTLRFTVSATDPDGGAVTYSAVSIPTGSTFTAGTGVFSWSPSYSQSGSYTARFQARDEDDLSSFLDVSITVRNVNRAPVLTVPSSPVHFMPTGYNSFTISATDPDGDELVFDAADMPRDWWGTYIDGPRFTAYDRTFTWSEPGSSNIDEYRVLFRVTDDGNPPLSDSAWVTIQVYDTISQLTNSRYPVLERIGHKQVDRGEACQFYVSATDPDGNPLSYSAAAISGKQAPTNYSFTDVVFGSTVIKLFSWSSDTPGNYWMRFTATDTADHAGYGLSDSEDVVITVGNVNRPPVLDPIGRRAVYNGGDFEFVVTATDPERNSLTYGATGLPSGAVFSPSTQTFTWSPTGLSVGSSYTVRFTVTDNGSPQESDYEDVVFTVIEPQF